MAEPHQRALVERLAVIAAQLPERLAADHPVKREPGRAVLTHIQDADKMPETRVLDRTGAGLLHESLNSTGPKRWMLVSIAYEPQTIRVSTIPARTNLRGRIEENALLQLTR